MGGKQSIANTFTSGCLSITLKDEANNINLNNTYPISNEQGKELTPYTFTVKNNCSTDTNFQVHLESMNKKSNSLETEYIKAYLFNTDYNIKKITKLSNYPSVTPSITGAYEAENLITMNIKGNEELHFELRIWMDYETTTEEGLNKEYTSKISVIASNQIKDTTLCETHIVETTLGTLAVSNCEPNFNVSLDLPTNEVCKYDGTTVGYTEEFKKENCQKVYKHYVPSYDFTEYLDKSLEETYVGEGVWDSATSTCKYNNQKVMDLSGTSINQEGNCGKVYDLYQDGTYFSNFEEVGSGVIEIPTVSSCKYNNVEVESLDYSKESCQKIYKHYIPRYDDTIYFDKSIEETYVGEGIWDSAASTCKYNDTEVVDQSGSSINQEENCGKIYYFYGRYYSNFEEVGSGEYKAYVQTGSTGIYETEDNDGTSYYYRGDSTNNYVKFGKWNENTPDVYAGYNEYGSFNNEYSTLAECQANSDNSSCELVSRAGKDMYWRIVRINGDDSVRLIYDGTQIYENTPQVIHDRVIGYFPYNYSFNKSEYVGYTYEEGNQRPSNYSTARNSEIKTYLESWYTYNLKSYENYIQTDSRYCNDREVATGYTWSSEAFLYYAPYERYNKYQPSNRCKNMQDSYILNVGLITSDEVLFAGERTSFLQGLDFWTMSPFSFQNGFSYSYIQNGQGQYVYLWYFGARPVINLKADTLKVGNGTASDPYRVS